MGRQELEDKCTGQANGQSCSPGEMHTGSRGRAAAGRDINASATMQHVVHHVVPHAAC